MKPCHTLLALLIAVSLATESLALTILNCPPTNYQPITINSASGDFLVQNCLTFPYIAIPTSSVSSLSLTIRNSHIRNIVFNQEIPWVYSVTNFNFLAVGSTFNLTSYVMAPNGFDIMWSVELSLFNFNFLTTYSGSNITFDNCFFDMNTNWNPDVLAAAADIQLFRGGGDVRNGFSGASYSNNYFNFVNSRIDIGSMMTNVFVTWGSATISGVNNLVISNTTINMFTQHGVSSILWNIGNAALSGSMNFIVRQSRISFIGVDPSLPAGKSVIAMLNGSMTSLNVVMTVTDSVVMYTGVWGSSVGLGSQSALLDYLEAPGSSKCTVVATFARSTISLGETSSLVSILSTGPSVLTTITDVTLSVASGTSAIFAQAAVNSTVAIVRSAIFTKDVIPIYAALAARCFATTSVSVVDSNISMVVSYRQAVLGAIYHFENAPSTITCGTSARAVTISHTNTRFLFAQFEHSVYFVFSPVPVGTVATMSPTSALPYVLTLTRCNITAVGIGSNQFRLVSAFPISTTIDSTFILVANVKIAILGTGQALFNVVNSQIIMRPTERASIISLANQSSYYTFTSTSMIMQGTKGACFFLVHDNAFVDTTAMMAYTNAAVTLSNSSLVLDCAPPSDMTLGDGAISFQGPPTSQSSPHVLSLTISTSMILNKNGNFFYANNANLGTMSVSISLSYINTTRGIFSYSNQAPTSISSFSISITGSMLTSVGGSVVTCKVNAKVAPVISIVNSALNLGSNTTVTSSSLLAVRTGSSMSGTLSVSGSAVSCYSVTGGQCQLVLTDNTATGPSSAAISGTTIAIPNAPSGGHGTFYLGVVEAGSASATTQFPVSVTLNTIVVQNATSDEFFLSKDNATTSTSKAITFAIGRCDVIYYSTQQLAALWNSSSVGVVYGCGVSFVPPPTAAPAGTTTTTTTTTAAPKTTQATTTSTTTTTTTAPATTTTTTTAAPATTRPPTTTTTTAAPGVTTAPGATAAPEVTTAPGSTAAPGATTAPGVTTAPGSTAAPGATTAPGVTTAPGATAAPGSTTTTTSTSTAASGTTTTTPASNKTLAPSTAAPTIAARASFTTNSSVTGAMLVASIAATLKLTAATSPTVVSVATASPNSASAHRSFGQLAASLVYVLEFNTTQQCADAVSAANSGKLDGVLSAAIISSNTSTTTTSLPSTTTTTSAPSTEAPKPTGNFTVPPNMTASSLAALLQKTLNLTYLPTVVGNTSGANNSITYIVTFDSNSGLAQAVDMANSKAIPNVLSAAVMATAAPTSAPTPAPASSSKTGVIVGVIVGLLVVGGIVGGVLWYRNNRDNAGTGQSRADSDAMFQQGKYLETEGCAPLNPMDEMLVLPPTGFAEKEEVSL